MGGGDSDLRGFDEDQMNRVVTERRQRYRFVFYQSCFAVGCGPVNRVSVSEPCMIAPRIGRVAADGSHGGIDERFIDVGFDVRNLYADFDTSEFGWVFDSQFNSWLRAK